MDRYLHHLTHLNTDKSNKTWTPLTNNQAPHKPLLLLSIIDLFTQGAITENFIEPSYELLDTFNTYWTKLPLSRQGNMAYPFPRLKSDGFWHLVPNPGYEDKLPVAEFSSMTRLREYCAGARLDEELYRLMQDTHSREALRGVLIQTYFAPEIQPLLLEQGAVNYEAYEYSKELLKLKEETAVFERIKEPVRDQGFRRAIVSLYDHRCAICGIRMLTPSGHTIVDASHIKPWSESFDDHPTNGLCLCKLCHWSFDEGIVAIGKKYEVLVSPIAKADTNIPGHILTFHHRPIFYPTQDELMPGQGNIEWHRKTKFART